MFGFTTEKKLRSAQIAAISDRLSFNALVKKYRALQEQWDELVDLINSKGGQQFLDHATMDKPVIPFNKEELKYILKRCHFDRNLDSELAHPVTCKLLDMLKALEGDNHVREKEAS